MARRRESLVDVLLVLPWWVAVAVGVLGYVAIKFVLPTIATSPMLAAIASGIEPFALIWLAVCGAAGAGSAVRAYFIRRKFDRQSGLEEIRNLSWRQFESIVGEAFRRRGYSVLENAVDGADGGVDLVLRKGGEKYFVQCKQWKRLKVGVKPVRELLGVVSAGQAAGGIFVTSGEYTAEARKFSEDNRLQLINGAELAQLIEEARAPAPFMDPTVRGRDPTIRARPAEAPSCPTRYGA